MTTDNEEYILGEEVTSVAAGKSRGGTAVLSVRLPLEEFAEVEAWSQAEGKTLSQIVREALKMALHMNRSEGRTITISVAGGATATTGAPGQWGEATMVRNVLQPTAA